MEYDSSVIYKSEIGDIVLFSKDEYLVGLYFKDTISFDYEIDNNITSVLKRTIDWLDLYFDSKQVSVDIPILLQGTDFQLKVWEYVRKIEYGKTVSYGQIASKVARDYHIEKMSNQAIGTAVSKNPISIIVPCHRVIKADGSLGKYAGNEDRKLFLLQLEKR